MLSIYKKLFAAVVALGMLVAGHAQGQISIMIVDDSDDGFNHISDFENVVSDLGYTFTSFDAQGTAMVPTAAAMSAYDLVIWHCGADSDSLAFWNFADTSNTELESYLSGGGNLWLIGTDVLYDRYGGAPVTYSPGSFEFDYLGITSYDVQTQVDDGGMGLPKAVPASASPIMGLPDLTWIFSTLWYVDGVTPINNGALPVYVMGDTSYTFSGYPCGVWFDNGTSQALSFYFNVSQIVDSTTMSTMTAAVLGYFSSQIVGMEEADAVNSLGIYPNPVADFVRIRLGDGLVGEGLVSVYSLAGQKVLELPLDLGQSPEEIELSVEGLQAGLYLVKAEVGGQVVRGSFVKR